MIPNGSRLFFQSEPACGGPAEKEARRKGPKVCAVMFSDLVTLGNWSTDFVFPYRKFLSAMDRVVEASEAGDTKIPDSLFVTFDELVDSIDDKTHVTRDVIKNGINRLETEGVESAAASVRMSVFRRARGFLASKSEQDKFVIFFREWIRWRGNKELEDAEMNAASIKNKVTTIQKNVQNRTQHRP